MRNKIAKLLTVILAFTSFPLLAAQTFNVKDGGTVTINISTNELSRVTIGGAGRIDKVWGTAGVLEIQPDKEKGEIFIRPTQAAPPALSFFIRDDLGATYTLVATHSDIPSETIILTPKGRHKSVAGTNQRVQPHIEMVKHLVKSMALGNDLEAYSVEDFQQDVPLWNETQIVLKRVYQGIHLVGEIYTIKNISTEEILFQESEFLDFGSNVQAVALDDLDIAPGEATQLYVVRKNAEAEG